jgi:hypothetical protein
LEGGFRSTDETDEHTGWFFELSSGLGVYDFNNTTVDTQRLLNIRNGNV